jgi:hypothetical protein
VKLDRLRLVSLWAWFSGRPKTFGCSLIDKRWTPDIGARAAFQSADKWRTAIDLHVHLGLAPIADLWLRPARIYGYDFHPLACPSPSSRKRL